MPLARYFFFCGASLLALLFVVDAYLPKLPAEQTEVTAAVADLSGIRIHSDRKWPQAVVFDTNVPVIVAAPPGVAEAPVPETAGGRESFAQLPSTDPRQIHLADVGKPEPKVHPKRKAIAGGHTRPDILVAQQPRFGLFGNNVW
jgi:hypothetical protein